MHPYTHSTEDWKEKPDYCARAEERVQLRENPQGPQKGVLLQWDGCAGQRTWQGNANTRILHFAGSCAVGYGSHVTIRSSILL